MPAFQYVALTPAGKERKGIIEGDSPRHIRNQLREQGLTPLKVDESASADRREPDSGNGDRIRTFRGRLSTNELSLLVRQIATLINAGSPVEEAISATATYSENTRVKSLLLNVRSRVLEGHTLADSLAQYPRVFPEMFRATVAAGEQSGHLDGVLERLADYTEDRQMTQATVKKALVYPAVMIVASLAILYALLTFVMPQMVETFDNLGQDLPDITQILISVSEFTQAWGSYIIVGLVALAFGFERAMHIEGFKARVHALWLRIPLIRSMVRSANSAQFARTLSILASSGVPVLQSLDIAAQVITNRPMRQAVLGAAERVREGASLAKSLERSARFPPMMVHLIASGEGSGRLGFMLDKAASHLEREQDSLISAFLGLLQPLIVVVMGGAVLVIVLGMLRPIFELNAIVT
ncbi:MAG: type II secretion system inner membrane protein GspF [Pseudomonadota bacterium]